MNISGLLKLSLIDYPGKMAGVVFTKGCNFKCPSCHAKKLLDSNAPLIPEEEVFKLLEDNKNWTDGICICGGEPTIQKDLIDFISKIKKINNGQFLVKLDTNGSNPGVLEELLRRKIVDYVAMDIKGPEYLLPILIERYDNESIFNIKKSMNLVQHFPDYEFRTTLVPFKRNNEFSFFNTQEIKDIATFIINETHNNNHKYYIQKFIPRKETDGGLLNKEWEDCRETPLELLKKYYQILLPILQKTEIRG